MHEVERLIDSLHLKDLKNEIHPSIFDDNEEYDMLIVRLPTLSKELLVGKSLGFIFTQEKSYFYDNEKETFQELKSRFLAPHSIMDKVVDKLLKLFLNYQERISDIEEALYSDNTKESFLNEWLSIKIDILRIERILLRSSNTLSEFIEHYKDEENFPINHYIDIHEHLERTMRSSALQLSKLDDLYSFYNAKSNDKINKMIYILTIISAIFLPLNLVVGFFGMNTSALPFSEGTSGTLYAISLMATLVVITSTIVHFWRKKVEK